jgi:hypothetical protein
MLLHITHCIICGIALLRAKRLGCNSNADFAAMGDDCVLNDNTLYKEYNVIMNGLKQPIQYEKNIESDAKGNRDVFFNYLKIIRYGNISFRPISFNRLVNFVKNPKSNIYSLIDESIKITNRLPVGD